MKKIIILTICGLTYLNAWSLNTLSNKIFSDGKIYTISKEVEASGTNIRLYSWIDPFGRVCTSTYTDDKGGNPDCDFPPKGFDYDSFLKEAKD
jgi:hypothetical protein